VVKTANKASLIENYVYYTSGRTPALSGNTLFHAVNNVFSSASGHMIEGNNNGMGVYEGNYFVNCPVIVGAPPQTVRLFTSLAADVSKCASYLGRNCVSNSLSNSGAFSFSDTDILALFQGRTNIVAAASVSSIQSSVVTAAGNTL
jgi:pectin lyase